jgi:hypothetical protein
MVQTEISNLFHRNKTAVDINRALKLLTDNGLARYETVKTEGRPMVRWFAVV